MRITRLAAKQGSRPLPNYRKLLLEKKAELEREFGTNFHRLAEIDQEVGDDPEQLLQEESITVRLNRVLYDQLRQVDAALQRLQFGEYGRCASCGDPIAEKRLLAVPWTRNCLFCQEKGSSSRIPEEIDVGRGVKHAYRS